MFDVPFVSPALPGNTQTSILPSNYTFLPLRFICVLCAICGKNAIVHSTTDSTDLTDKIAGSRSIHQRCAELTWHCPAKPDHVFYAEPIQGTSIQSTATAQASYPKG